MIIAIISSHIFVLKPASDEEGTDIFILLFAFNVQRSAYASAMFYLHKNRFAIG